MTQRKAILASALLAAVAVGLGALIGRRPLRRSIPLDVLPESIARVMQKHISNQQLEAIGAQLRGQIAAGQPLTAQTIEDTIRRHITAEQWQAVVAELESTGIAQRFRTLTPSEQIRMLVPEMEKRWPGFGHAFVRYFDPESPDAVPPEQRGQTVRTLINTFVPEAERASALAALGRILGTTEVQGVYL